MKKGKDYFVRRFVYRLINGCYYRENYINAGGPVALRFDFPYIDRILVLFPSIKLCMKKPGMEITAWIDKHNNLIVRIIDQSIVQTQIDF